LVAAAGTAHIAVVVQDTAAALVVAVGIAYIVVVVLDTVAALVVAVGIAYIVVVVLDTVAALAVAVDMNHHQALDYREDLCSSIFSPIFFACHRIISVHP